MRNFLVQQNTIGTGTTSTHALYVKPSANSMLYEVEIILT